MSSLEKLENALALGQLKMHRNGNLFTLFEEGLFTRKQHQGSLSALLTEHRQLIERVEVLEGALQSISTDAQQSSHCAPEQGLQAIYSTATEALGADS